jgi:CD109 antigen
MNYQTQQTLINFLISSRYEGRTTLSKKVPDTITSWIITGFSVDPITGLGLTRQPSKFNVFQPFFVSTNLPYSIKRGEVVAIPVVVFNYMESDHRAEVTLFNSEGEFEFAEANEEENQVKRRKRAADPQRKKSIVVKSQSGTSVSFMIRPLKVGHITIKVVATSAVAGDGVERQLIVEPEGVTQYINKAVFIDLRNNPEFKTNITVKIPPNAVPDSTKIEASAIGDILGPSIENLDKLM